MKPNKLLVPFILTFIVSISVGCDQSSSKKSEENVAATIKDSLHGQKQLTTEEKEAIKKIISARVAEIVAGVTNKKIDSALKPYLNYPEFLLVTPDARITNYPEMIEEQRSFARQVSDANFTTIKEDFLFLGNDLVMCTWKGKYEYKLKNGEKYLIDPYVGSMLFRKANDLWSIVYAHESTGAAVKQ
ncbi:MAG: hypothetical protein EOO02_10130 [Chitinophagaceae bacterium]|nr:MAG: hypothetical protein EOO02_10130 [Chitinophagaceae bacterium]